MKNINPELSLKSEASISGLSDHDLALFLEGLAAIHSSPKLGNRELSLALMSLAQKVRKGDLATKTHPGKKTNRPVSLTEETISKLKELDESAINSFLSDKTKTKSDLIALASARFSIPTSQLKKSRVEEVRAALTSALLHEKSIEIISKEADKDGTKRTS